jgi:hypothetical protein
MNKTLILGQKFITMENKEIWKDVEGYEGKYQVSSFGRVRSFKQTNIYYFRGDKNHKGYIRVQLSNGKAKAFSIHRLVCKAFHPNPENKPAVNHKNGVKDDNRAQNLEWVTHSENHKHAFKNGYMCKKGVKHHYAKLTEEQAFEIKYGHKDLLQREMAELYGLTVASINDIIKGRTWKHI